MNFYLWRNGAEEGPFSFEDFESMFLRGETERETLFRRDSETAFDRIGDFFKRKEPAPAPPPSMRPNRAEIYAEKGAHLIATSRLLFWGSLTIMIFTVIFTIVGEGPSVNVTIAATAFACAMPLAALTLIAGILYRILASLERK